MSNLLERLSLKQERERQQIEDLTQRHFSKLAQGCSKQLSKELNTISVAITLELQKTQNAARDKMKKTLGQIENLNNLIIRQQALSRRLWLPPAVATSVTLLIILLSSWGLTAYLTENIKKMLIHQSELGRNLDQLERKGGGLRIHETKDGVFLELPAGASTGYTSGGKKFVKLPN